MKDKIELKQIILKFAESGWDVLEVPAKNWLLKSDKETVDALIKAVKKADDLCGNCGCEFDALYKKALLELKNN